MAEREDGDDRRATERMCALTREVRPIGELIRFVRAPDGTVVPDLRRKLPGRGVWITATRENVALGIKRGVFKRGFKDHINVEPSLADDVERLLERATLDMLSMANKAGRLVTGFGKVSDALSSGEAAALLHALDAADDGVRKLGQVARRSGATPLRLRLFRSEQMDLALGRSNVIHAALLAGPVGTAFLGWAAALARYRGADADVGGSEDEPGQPAETDVE